MRSKRMKYSTGRGSRVKYSTSMDWDEWKRKRRRYPVLYSTGEDSRILHSTGRELDMRMKLLEEERERSEQKSKEIDKKKRILGPLKKFSIGY